MPELPEVETLRQDLECQLSGRMIVSARAFPSRVLQLNPTILETELVDQTIRVVSRRAKYLVIELDRWHWIFHLGMTGQLIVRSYGDEGVHSDLTEVDVHTVLVVELTGQRSLMYRDVRKFGRVMMFSKEEDALPSYFNSLGPEPFGSCYVLEDFLEKLGVRKARIKSVLLDQRLVAGIGNIYADETLFEAGIHPARRVKSLRRWEKVRLFEAIPRVLHQGMLNGGTTLRDYRRLNGVPGANQKHLRVYGRNGKLCSNCRSTIEKIVISQRGTHFCPECQPRCPRSRSLN